MVKSQSSLGVLVIGLVVFIILFVLVVIVLKNSSSVISYCGDMSLGEAKVIAESDCGEVDFDGEFFCNDNTSTWWLDLELEQSGCSPACVINTVTGEANINYRCTGVIV